MSAPTQQGKESFVSDASFDSDARELFDLGKKPVLRVRVSFVPPQHC